jgi:5-methylcytosine-specific restriction endonuclease McrA
MIVWAGQAGRAREAFGRANVCSCPSRYFLEIDHVIPVEDHGPTELANLWRICSHHHALKTYTGWKVVDETRGRDLAPP